MWTDVRGLDHEYVAFPPTPCSSLPCMGERRVCTLAGSNLKMKKRRYPTSAAPRGRASWRPSTRDAEARRMPEEEKMPRKLIALFGLVAPVALSACGGGSPATEVAEETPVLGVATADSKSQFAGAWTLVKIERFDAAGELLAPPIEDRVGYIIYDPAGYMGVTIMQPDRRPYAGNQRTPEEVLAAYSTYSSYFGTFTVNEAEGFLTHHLEGSLNTRGARLGLQAFLYVVGKSAHAAAARECERQQDAAHLGEAPGLARIRAHGDAQAAVRLLPDRVGFTANRGRRVAPGQPVRNRVHRLRSLRAHGGASGASGPGAVRRYAADAGGGARGRTDVRQLLRSVLGT